MATHRRRRRRRQDLHFLSEDGMVACNPRDREAAHRAEMEGIATEEARAVTCRKCQRLLRSEGSRPERRRDRSIRDEGAG
jgi:hypothetical protein